MVTAGPDMPPRKASQPTRKVPPEPGSRGVPSVGFVVGFVARRWRPSRAESPHNPKVAGSNQPEQPTNKVRRMATGSPQSRAADLKTEASH
jgi:hypothetical protein